MPTATIVPTKLTPRSSSKGNFLLVETADDKLYVFNQGIAQFFGVGAAIEVEYAVNDKGYKNISKVLGNPLPQMPPAQAPASGKASDPRQDSIHRQVALKCATELAEYMIAETPGQVVGMAELFLAFLDNRPYKPVAGHEQPSRGKGSK